MDNNLKLKNKIEIEKADNAISNYNTIQKEERKKKNRRFIYLLLAIVTCLLFIRLFISPVAVVGNSMSPTYKSGQLILSVNANLKNRIDYNQVVSFKNKLTRGQMYIKRVLGLPGDVIQVKEGAVYRNGEKIEEDFPLMEEPGIFVEEWTLGEDEYFVLGDNRNASTDSRFLGAIHRDDICYVAIS